MKYKLVRYPNRKLYWSSAPKGQKKAETRQGYVDFAFVADRCVEGYEVEVVDNKTGADITLDVLFRVYMGVLKRWMWYTSYNKSSALSYYIGRVWKDVKRLEGPSWQGTEAARYVGIAHNQ